MKHEVLAMNVMSHLSWPFRAIIPDAGSVSVLTSTDTVDVK